jgi:hypothetical protein
MFDVAVRDRWWLKRSLPLLDFFLTLQSLLLVYLNVVFGGCRVFSVLFMNCVSVRGK